MVHRKEAVHIVALLTLLFGAAGCSQINRAGTKLDMAAEHVDQTGKPDFEGRLQSSKAIGKMYALQFEDGSYYDVSRAPEGLQPGDVVRIYKTDKGYEAHLWRATTTAD